MPRLVKPDICLGVNIKSLIVIVDVLDKRVDVGAFHCGVEGKVASGRAVLAKLKLTFLLLVDDARFHMPAFGLGTSNHRISQIVDIHSL